MTAASGTGAVVENKSIARLLLPEGTPVAVGKMLSHRSSHQGRGIQHGHFPLRSRIYPAVT